MTDDNLEDKKPLLELYNHTKESLDPADQMYQDTSPRGRQGKWTMGIVNNMLDVSGLNAFIIRFSLSPTGGKERSIEDAFSLPKWDMN